MKPTVKRIIICSVAFFAFACIAAVALVACGENAQTPAPEEPDSAAEEYYLELRYGMDIEMGAQQDAALLSSPEYIILPVVNDSGYLFSETLVIYRENSDLAVANDIQARLGRGRVIPSNGRFFFSGSILLIVVDDNARDHPEADAYDCIVAVRNGYGIADSAKLTASLLSEEGYPVSETGTMDSFIYKETLILYREETDQPQAESIQKLLGYGRTIPNDGRFIFEGNVLIIVGAEFGQP